MSYLKRRVKKIEDRLNIADEQTGVFIILSDERDAGNLPEPLEEWITYKEAKAKCGQVGIFIANPEKELKAREEQKTTLQKETIL